MMVKIKIDGKEHDAMFTLRAQKTYKDMTGGDITTLEGLDEVATFIYCCIDAAYKFKKQPHDVTLDAVYDFVDFESAVKVIRTIMPKPEGE